MTAECWRWLEYWLTHALLESVISNDLQWPWAT